MAYDSLKALIRQYIKTNGEQEITGQILQNVLVEMVNQYPSTDGYATQSWVTSQLAGYATTSQLADYLPLTGGELTGYLIIDSLYSTGWNAASNNKTYTCIDSNGTITSILIAGGSERSRTTITPSSVSTGAVNANSFVVSGGTSAQFLKADGSVDSSTYITASALSGYATQSWVTSQLEGYATTSQLADYLPLTGGTITGNLTVNGAVKFNSNLTFAYDRGIYFGTDNNVRIMRDNSRLLILNETNSYTIIGNWSNENCVFIVNDLLGGTANSTYSTFSPEWSIQSDGSAQFNSVSQTSDLHKKTITGDVPINLYNVANAPLFKFTWKDEKKYSGQHIGSAAQYWQTVLPELVSIGRDADMTLAMQYDVIALASAITVAKTVVNHEERIILLERENEALKKEIADLKSA